MWSNRKYGRVLNYPDSPIPQRIDLNPGNSVGSYNVLEILGEGSFGNVYKVSKNERIYALKILRLYEIRPDLRNEIVKRFDREFDCGIIESDYLIKSYEKGIYKGNPYFIMDYCKSGSGRNLVGKINTTEFNKLIVDVLLGLKDLHKAGVIHRDIKPDNILKDAHGGFKLCDFGISAYSKSRLTQAGFLARKQIFGTYPYLAPEMLDGSNGKPLLPASDIYSLGVTLFEIITGILPFGQINHINEIAAYLDKAKKHSYDCALLNSAGIDKELQSVIHKSIAPKLKDRYENVDQIISELKISISTKSKNLFFDRDIVGFKVMYGDESGRIYNLSKLIPGPTGMATIGWCNPKSIGKNDIEIVEKYTAFISRKHATILKEEFTGKWVLKDGQRMPNGTWKYSLNGTYVNGIKIPPSGHELSLGDIIMLGETTLKFVKK